MANNGASSVSIYSSADPTHGVVLLGEQIANSERDNHRWASRAGACADHS